MSSSNVFTLRDFSRACADCQLQDLCLPIGIPRHELRRLDQIVHRRHSFKRGETLYEQGDHFHSLFVVCSGSVKALSFSQDGRDQITAFHLPGEILGLDAISENEYSSAAIALEETKTCQLPFDRLHAFAQELEDLQTQLLRIMSRKLGADARFARIIATRSADERLAAFLLNVGTRYGLRGFSSTEFTLSMTRTDIGKYLGLTNETVSRLFARFQRDGLIAAEGKAVKLLQRKTLERMAGDGVALGFKPTGQDCQR